MVILTIQNSWKEAQLPPPSGNTGLDRSVHRCCASERNQRIGGSRCERCRAIERFFCTTSRCLGIHSTEKDPFVVFFRRCGTERKTENGHRLDQVFRADGKKKKLEKEKEKKLERENCKKRIESKNKQTKRRGKFEIYIYICMQTQIHAPNGMRSAVDAQVAMRCQAEANDPLGLSRKQCGMYRAADREQFMRLREARIRWDGTHGRHCSINLHSLLHEM